MWCLSVIIKVSFVIRKVVFLYNLLWSLISDCWTLVVSAWSGGHKWKLSFSRCRRREPGDHWPPGRHSPCPPPAVSPPWTRGSLSPPACQVIIGESSNSEMHSWITRSDRDVWRSPCPDTSTVSRTEGAYKEILEVAVTLNLHRPPHQTREPIEVQPMLLTPALSLMP